MMNRFLVLLIFVAPQVFPGCAIGQQGAASQTAFATGEQTTSKGKVTQAELQDDLLRFESQFNARIQDASQKLETSSKAKIRYRAALNRLIYNANSLNIALGPSPESNLLDMVAFIELSRNEYEKYWLPKFFGKDGEALTEAFDDSAHQIWAIAGKVLGPAERQTLQKVIWDWRRKHAEQIDVETVRLSAFSSEAGAKAAGLDENIGGLFASVQQSTQAVDAAKLFGERVLYYAQRAPFLFRLQARLGSHEILDDAGLSLGQLGDQLGNNPGLKELFSQLQKTLVVSQATLQEMNATAKSVDALLSHQSDNPEITARMGDSLTKLGALLKDWNHFVDSPNSRNSVAQMAGVAKQAERQGGLLLNKFAWLGAALITFFWCMALASRLAFHYITARLPAKTRSTDIDRPRDRAA